MSDDRRLLVVPGDADVRWRAAHGQRAVSQAELRRRLRVRLAPGRAVASPRALRLALGEVLRALARDDRWLAAAHERGGAAWLDLVAAVDATLTEAHRATWYAALREGGGLEDDPRARALSAAAAGLEQALARAEILHPAAEDEALARAVSRTDAAELVDALGATHVVASGITSFSPAELTLVRALDARLSLRGGSASVELAELERPLDAARATDPLGRLLEAVAEALDAPPHPRPVLPILGDLAGGERLTDAARARVELRRADTPRAEARGIADAVRAALSTGTPPEAIVVVADALTRAPVVRLLEEAGVVVDDVGGAGRGSGLAALVLEVLAVAAQGAPRLRLASLLRSPYVDPASLTGERGAERARSRVEALARVLEGTREVGAERPSAMLARTVAAFEGRTDEPIEELSRLAARVGELFERATSGSTGAEHAARAKELLAALGVRARPSRGAARYLAGDAPLEGLWGAELAAFARDARAEEEVAEALDAYVAEVTRLGIDAPLRFDAFAGELARSLDLADRSRRAGGGGASFCAVRVCSLDEVPFRPLSLLVVADLHASALDPVDRDPGLLAPSSRRALTEAIEPALRPTLHAARDARLVRLASVAGAAERVVLSYTTRDEEGAQRAPHPLVAWLAEEGARESVWRDRIVAPRPLTAREARLRDLAGDRARARVLLPHAAERAAVEARREAWFGAIRASAEEPPPPALSSAIQAILEEETGGGARPLGVTALDRFGACPFQGFAVQVLGGRTKPVLGDLVDLREEGILLHSALAAAFEATRALWSARPRDARAIRARARAAATELLGHKGAPSRVLRATLAEIADRVTRVIEWSLLDLDWDFAHAEAGFGRRGAAWGPARLDDGVTRVDLTGTIDRVDRAHDGAGLRVLDYKRSEDSARRMTDDLGEHGFQLAVYGRAVSSGSGTPVVTGVYLPTRRLTPSHATRGGDEAWSRAHAETEGLPRFERSALELLRAARRGDVAPRTHRPDTCRWCDHDGGCRKPRFIITSAPVEGSEARDGA